jgi:hypothetical protein
MRLLRLCLPIALVLAATAVSASAQSSPRSGSALPEVFSRLEAGAPTPMGHRPPSGRVSLRNRVMGIAPEGAVAAFSDPAEFGVSFEYDGMRADLERAGIRVQSQIGRLYTARVRRGEIGSLRAVTGLQHVRLARYLEPHLNLSIPDVRADLEHGAIGTPPVYHGRAGRGVLLGDVDTGIDFTSSDFDDSLGQTRILYIWDQTDVAGPGPAAFGYGSEWTKSQIDNTPASVRHRDTNGHGTEVAGVMIGNGSSTGCGQAAYRFVGVAPEAKFIEVATDFTDTGIIDGVNYIFQKAAALGMDCVVNLSLGSNYGPHDGTGMLSQAVGALTGPGRIVIASSGNAQADGLHGKLVTTSQTVGTDRFQVTVPAYTANAGIFNDYFLVTGWYDPTASLTIRVKGPTAADTLSVGLGGAKDRNLTVASGKGGKLFMVNQNASQGYAGTATGRQFEIQVYDSVSTSPPRNGVWEIDVVPNNPASIGKRVDIWVYADQFGAAGAAASVTFNRDNTTMVGEPADADSVIAVGAHTTKASWASCLSGSCSYSSAPIVNTIASFSCVGPRRDGVIKPELTAPGYGVATTHSSFSAAMVSCDADDNTHGVTQGTSFSAPHVSAAAGLFLMYQPHSSPSKIRQSFESHARVDAATGAVPNGTWGYGKLDIYATIDHVVPSCAVTAPAGGESWSGGATQAITWTATDNVGVTGVNVEYSLHGASGPWVAVATGIANSGSQSWTLPNTASDSGLVRVTASDAGGNATVAQSAALFHVASSADVRLTPVLAALWLKPPVPNPSNGSVGLRFSLARAGRATLEVYGLRGERVWSQDWADLAPGEHVASWSGRDASGHRAGAGLFFVRLTTGSGTRNTRLVRLD